MRPTNVLCTLGLALTASALSNADAGLGEVAQRDLAQAARHYHARAHRRRHRKRNANCKAKAAKQQSPAPVAATVDNAPPASSWAPQVAVVAPAALETVETVWSQTVAPAAAVAWTPSAEPAPVAQPTPAGNAGLASGALAGITGFLGTNTGIGSWFRTNSGQDSTNGKSWCDLAYQDDWLGFAPDVSIMLNNFGGDRTTAGGHYCGLEALAINPANGKTALIYIVDGFDPAWIRVPGSIDLTLGAFKALHGSETGDKNVVIQNLQWKLTGNRLDQYKFGANRNW